MTEYFFLLNNLVSVENTLKKANNNNNNNNNKIFHYSDTRMCVFNKMNNYIYIFYLIILN